MNAQILSLPAGLHVRPSNKSDDAFLTKLYRSTRDDLDLLDASKEFITEFKDSQYLAQTAGYQEQFPNAMFFTIEYYDQAVGRIVVDFGANEVLVVDIAFTKDAQGKGLGSGVIRSFMHCAEQIRLPLRLSVLSQNVRAKAFYAKLGFVFEESLGTRDYLIYYPSSQAACVSA